MAEKPKILAEITDKRTEKSKTYLTDKPGVFRVRAYGGPMHYKDAEGNWQNIDLALEDIGPSDPGYAKGYRKRCVKTKIGVYLKPDVSEDNAIGAEYDGAKIGFALKSVAYLDIQSKDYSILSQARTVAPTVGQKDITWENVLPQVDYRFAWGKARGKIEIVLKQDNLPDPADYGYDPAKTYLVFIEKIETSLKTWIGDNEKAGDCEAAGRISLKTAAQELKYLLPVGNAIDASGEEVKARYRVVRKGGNTFLLIGVPYSWLKDPARQWPIVIDPTYQSSTADGSIFGGYSESWAVIRASETGVTVYRGNASMAYPICAYWLDPEYYIYRSFFYFDTTAIPSDATIDSVDLKIYGYTNAESDVAAQKGTQTDVLAKEDFDAFVGTTGEGDPDGREYGHVSWNNTTWNTISFNATGKGDIEKDGTTKVCCREYTHDYLNGDPGTGSFKNGCYFAEESGKEPYLDIEYTVGAPPTVTTQAADQIKTTSARGNGNITDDGGASITQHGVCWKKGADPVNIAGSDAYSQEGAGTEGAFTSDMTSLDPETTYYYRAYATNAQGTSYGGAQSFKTMISAAASGLAASEGEAGGLLALIGDASGQGASLGEVAGLLALIGGTEGQTTSTGDAAGLLGLRGDAEGQIASSGESTAYIGLPASASGQAISTGVASALLALIGQADGQAISEGVTYALLELLAGASGAAVSSGDIMALLALLAAAEGQVTSSGEAALAIEHKVSAIGAAISQGAAAALLQLMGRATGLTVTTWDIIIPNFTGELAPGETLVIDFKAKTVTIDGVNVLKYFTMGDFPNLPPGGSMVKYADLEDSRDLTITVTWKDKWL